MIDVTATQFLLVKNIHQTHDWILIGSGANGIGIRVFVGLMVPGIDKFLNLNPLAFLLDIEFSS